LTPAPATLRRLLDVPPLTPDTRDFAAVMAAVRAGDPAARERLLGHYYPAVRRLVHRSLAADLRRRRPWLAAMFSTGDVVQEVFCSIVRDLDHFASDNEGAFVNYLATLVKNRLSDAVRFHEAMRRDARRASESVENLGERQPAGGEPIDQLALEERVRGYCAAVQALPQREQTLLRERLDGEATFKDLAARLGFPSEDAARKAFCAAQARVLLRLQRGARA
jgi:RNA polymerase sigma factor (sigma-70 family)